MPKLTRNPASIVESSPVCLEYEDIAAAKESFLPSSEGEAISERTRQEEWMEEDEPPTTIRPRRRVTTVTATVTQYSAHCARDEQRRGSRQLPALI